MPKGKGLRMPRGPYHRRRSNPIAPPSEWADVGAGVAAFLDQLFSIKDYEYEQIGVTIPAPMFRKLIALCHPDKHHNSEMSQEVTRWLIDQREKTMKTIR